MKRQLPGFASYVEYRQVESETCYKYSEVTDLLTTWEINQLNKIIQAKMYNEQGDAYIFQKDWQYFIDASGITVKAHNGDRKKNLESIADSVDKILDNPQAKESVSLTNLNGKEVHQIKGWMEQLRIIADEWETNQK